MSNEEIAVVTVGSTHFDALVGLFEKEDVLDALRRVGIRRLVVQHGKSGFRPRDTELETVHFAYSEDLIDWLARASLVISHAGMGTVLDVSGLNRSGRGIVHVAVANRALANDHQLETVRLLDSLKTQGRWMGVCLEETSALEAFLLSPHLSATIQDTRKLVETSRDARRGSIAPILAALTK